MSTTNFENFIKYILVTLGTFLVSIIFFNGWFFDLSFGGYDLLSGHSTSLAQFKNSGDWSSLVYSFLYLGGSEVLPLTGMLPIQRLFLFLFENPIQIASLSMLFILYLLSISLVELTKETTRYLYDINIKFNNYILILLTLSFTFMPILAWRINHGHLNILNGLLATAMCFYIPLIVRNNSITLMKWLLIILCLIHAVPFSSQQMLVYSIFFTSPFWISHLIFSIKQKKIKSLGIVIFAIVFSVLCILPTLSLTLSYFLGSSSQRDIADISIFSYIMPSIEYLTSSLGLSIDYIPIKYNYFSHHEINYPIGWVLLLLTIVFLFNNKANIKRISLLLFPLLYTIVFSFDVFGLTSFLVKHISVLGAFRVPYRSMLILILAMTVFVVSSLLKLYKEDNFDKRLYILSLLIIPIGSIINVYYFEIFSVIIIITLLVFHYFKKPNNSLLFVSLFSLLIGNSIGAFKERFSDKSVIQDASLMLSQMKLNDLKLNKGYKAISYLGVSQYSENFLTMNNISVINSYWHPQKSFNETYSLLFGLKNEKTRLSFNIPFNSDGYETFTKLYATRSIIAIKNDRGSNRVEVNNLEGLKNIWSPTKVYEFEDKSEMLSELKSETVKDKNYIYKNIYVEKNIGFNKKIEACTDFKLNLFKVNSIEIEVNSLADCVIAMPFNFSKYLIAEDQNKKEYKIFKAYGSIFGVLIPASKKIMNIKIHSPHPYKSYFYVSYLAYFIFLILLLMNLFGVSNKFNMQRLIKKT